MFRFPLFIFLLAGAQFCVASGSDADCCGQACEHSVVMPDEAGRLGVGSVSSACEDVSSSASDHVPSIRNEIDPAGAKGFVSIKDSRYQLQQVEID